MTSAGTFYIAGGGTGGHLYPGIAIAEALVAQRPNLDVMFLGAQRGIERTVLPTTRWRHQLLDLHPLYRSEPWQNWRTVRGLASAYGSIDALARRSTPLGVLGTGGYAAGALLGYARLNGLPYFLQEQNAYAGLTVRLFSPGARATFLGFPEAVQTLPASGRPQSLVTGNPITPPPSPLTDRAEARRRWGFPPETGHVLLIFGGSQGSRAINDAIGAWITNGLPVGWGAIWVTGSNEHVRFAHLNGGRIRVVGYQNPMSDAYAAAELAVSRAGAMSTAELCAWGIPMILIPLPTAAADHQSQNADALVGAGAARVVRQSALSAGELADALTAIASNTALLVEMGRAARGRARTDAAQVIAQHILSSLNLT